MRGEWSPSLFASSRSTVEHVPTADDYRAGIAELDRRLEGVAGVQRACDKYREDFGYVGGVSGLIRDGMIAGAANASAAGVGCNGLRGELERRAGLCDQFSLEMNLYRSAHSSWRTAYLEYSNTSPDQRRHLGSPIEPQPPEPPFVGAQAARSQAPR